MTSVDSRQEKPKTLARAYEAQGYLSYKQHIKISSSKAAIQENQQQTSHQAAVVAQSIGEIGITWKYNLKSPHSMNLSRAFDTDTYNGGIFNFSSYANVVMFQKYIVL